MKKVLLITVLSFLTLVVVSQNNISLHFGYLSTSTSTAEIQTRGGYFYSDSVSTEQINNSFYAGIDFDIDLGTNFYLSNGISYSRKGIGTITYTPVNAPSVAYYSDDDYIGYTLMLKYRINLMSNHKLRLILGAGLKSDFHLVPLDTKFLYSGEGAEFINAYKNTVPVELIGVGRLEIAYKLGIGDLSLNFLFQKGLTDIINNPYIVGKTDSFGVNLGYTFYLNNNK